VPPSPSAPYVCVSAISTRAVDAVGSASGREDGKRRGARPADRLPIINGLVTWGVLIGIVIGWRSLKALAASSGNEADDWTYGCTYTSGFGFSCSPVGSRQRTQTTRALCSGLTILTVKDRACIHCPDTRAEAFRPGNEENSAALVSFLRCLPFVWPSESKADLGLGAKCPIRA
jgi:hypothetical protein